MFASFKKYFFADDLFIRVLFCLWGGALVLIGGAMIFGFISIAHDAPLTVQSMIALTLMVLLGALSVAMGIACLGRVVLPATSRLSRYVEKKFHPDTVDAEGILLILGCVLFPALVITCVLKAFGVHGQVRIKA